MSTLLLFLLVFGLVVWGIKWRASALGYQVSYACLAAQILNLLTGGKWNETLSGRVGTRVSEGASPKWLWSSLNYVINLLFWDDEHCNTAALRAVLNRIRGTLPFLDPIPEDVD